VVPGVVALVVDFSSGAMYSNGGGGEIRISARGNLSVRLPESETPSQIGFRLVTSQHRVLAEKKALLGPTVHGQSVELQVKDWLRPYANEKVYLEVVAANGASARFPTSMEVAP
jgi:hypothetical protein